MIKLLDDALGDLRQIELDIRLHRDIDLGTGRSVVAGQPRKTIERMPDRVQPRDRHRQRALPLCLVDNLVDARLQAEIGGVQILSRRQAGDRRGAARHLLHDLVGRGKPEAIHPMPVQARGVQIIVTRDLTAGLPGRQPTVNFFALDMLGRYCISAS